MKNNKKKKSKKTILGIYRRPNMNPVIRYYESLADVHSHLGGVPLNFSEIYCGVYIVNRADAKKNGEPRNMYNNITNGEFTHTYNFHGDVVIIGYDPASEQIKSLTKDQINMVMNSPRI